MKKSAILILVLVITGFQIKIYGQDSLLYMPINFKKAYDNGTRTLTGKPGPKYWQNYADYNIQAEIDTSTRSIIGSETIVYKNNSPDTLRTLVFRLYQNLYKKGTFRDFPIDTVDLTNGVKIKELTINGRHIDIDSPGVKLRIYGTNMFFKPDSSIFPKQELNIECKWSFRMPLETDIRMGMIDSTSYYVGYWYPQVSVYDDIDGWDITQYTGGQEFYNNFGNFDVEIKVPKNYIVWATGLLQNPDEVLTNKYLDRIKSAETSDSVIHIITLNDLKNGDITSNNRENTWHFRAEDVTDFAFAASDHYLWDSGSLIVDSTTGRRTVVAAAYRKEALDFPHVTEIGIKALKYYSQKIPGVPFPYPKITVVNGARTGGMEYPMMVNDYSAHELTRTIGVTDHEIAHTYFPFYMGINERKYAWMDEGWASTLPVGIEYDSVNEYYSRKWIAESYEMLAGNELEIPMMTPSIFLHGYSYTVASYSKPAEAYLTLKDMLGEENFLKALHEYINRWHGKHPIPYDFFYSFNDALNENLNWYWKSWFFEPGYPDLAIKKVTVEGNEISVVIKKAGSVPVPLKVTEIYKDGTRDSLYQTAAIWKDKSEFTIKLNSDKKLYKIILGGDQIPDIDKKNNVYILKE